MAAEPDAAAQLLDLCAGLPLALAIVGARCTTYGTFPLGALSKELTDQSTRLGTLGIGDRRAVFSWSVDALEAEAAADAFAMLGLTPGTDIGAPATEPPRGLMEIPSDAGLPPPSR